MSSSYVHCICSSAQRVLSDPVVRVPHIVIRKKVQRNKGTSQVDAEINEVHDLLATAQRKLQRLEERKKNEEEEESDESEEVGYIYQFRGPQPLRGGGAGGGGFGYYGGAASMR